MHRIYSYSKEFYSNFVSKFVQIYTSSKYEIIHIHDFSAKIYISRLPQIMLTYHSTIILANFIPYLNEFIQSYPYLE